MHFWSRLTISKTQYLFYSIMISTEQETGSTQSNSRQPSSRFPRDDIFCKIRCCRQDHIVPWISRFSMNFNHFSLICFFSNLILHFKSIIHCVLHFHHIARDDIIYFSKNSKTVNAWLHSLLSLLITDGKPVVICCITEQFINLYSNNTEITDPQIVPEFLKLSVNFPWNWA